MAITRIGNPAIADQRGINFRNIIINGGMDLAQRGTSQASAGAGYHTCDRWRIGTGGSQVFTMSQDTDVPSAQGFAKSLKLACTTANASLSAGDQFHVGTRFEGQNLQFLKYGTSSAETMTLSFWVKSNKTGTLTVRAYSNDATRSLSQYYTISSANTWEKKTITFNGDTVGTFDNDNALSMQLDWFMLFGSNYTSGTASNDWRSYVAANDGVNHTVNLADSTSNYINITGVQLEAGQVASDFEFLPIDVNEERCRRYFQKSYTRGEYAGTATNSAMVTTARIQNTVTNRPTNVFFRPILRATPTMTIYSINGTSGSVSDLGTGTAHQRDEPSVVAVLSSMGMGYLTGVSGLTAGDGFGFHYTADAEL